MKILYQDKHFTDHTISAIWIDAKNWASSKTQSDRFYAAMITGYLHNLSSCLSLGKLQIVTEVGEGCRTL